MANTPKNNRLKPSTKNQAEGKLREVGGKVAEKAGRITGDRDLESQGKESRIKGKVQKKVGQIQKVFDS